ncbi:MAG: alpha-2-macroglobulin family protein [Thermoanaerobaculia bacterium]
MSREAWSFGWLKDRKNVAIVGLGALVAVLAGALALERVPTVRGWFAPRLPGQPVAIADVILDRADLTKLEIFFDRPLGKDLVGQVLDPDPATLKPAVGGVWSWQATNVLRFEPTGGFQMATEYEVTLVPERLTGDAYHFTGDTSAQVRTDDFLVERVDVRQEPRLEGKNEVVIVGNLRFNYPVEPEELAPRLRLVDPARGEGDPVPVVIQTYYRDRVIAFRSDPVRKQPKPRDLRLVIRGDLTPAAGNVPLGNDHEEVVALGSSEVLSVWQVVPQPGEGTSSLRIRFSSPVDAETAADFLTVDPLVDYRLTAAGNELVLTGGFAPGASYELKLAEGLPSSDDAVLREPWSERVQVPDLPESLGFQGDGMFLSAAGGRRLALESVNVTRADLVVERVYRNNLHYLFQSYGYEVWEGETYAGSSLAHSLGDRIAEERLDLGRERNRRQVLPLELDRYIGNVEPGLYRVAVSRPGSYQAVQRWVLVTDIGMVAKTGDDEVLVWASSFADLSPVAGARLTLLSDQNQLIATGQTDARGIWHGRGLGETLADNRPFLLLAERGADFSFLVLDSMRVDTAGLEVGGAERAPQGYDAYLYGERDIYRPGELVEGVAVVRDNNLEPPPPLPVLLRHRDPRGMEGVTQRLETDEQGLAAFELELPEYALTGHHSLELLAGDRVIGSYRWQVEEFVPDRIRVDVSVGEGPFGPGDELQLGVHGAYLFGPPAAGLAVEARVRLEPDTFAPPGYDTYTFTDGERRFTGRELSTDSGVLDAEGSRALTVTVPKGLRVPSSLRAVVIARVQEAGGRGVVARQTAPVHPYPYYLGLRRGRDGYGEPGRPESFELVALNADGKPAQAAGRLRAELFKDEWDTVLRRTPAGTFRYETSRTSRPVDSRIVGAAGGSGRFELTAREFGSYRAVLSDPETGASTQVHFYVSGFGYSPWAIENPARVELDLDREEYRPGESASVQIRSPFAGKLLLTVEGDRVLDTRILDLEGNTATVSLPVSGSYRPNVYVTATVVRAASALDAGQDTVGRAFGAVPLAVDRASNRLRVSIEAPEEVRPGTALEVSVTTEPGAALTLAAVDEGILQLIAQETPDPFTHFYRKLALGVDSADSFALLLPEVEIEGAAAAGGDEAAAGAAQYVRTEGIRRVEPVAFWSGLLRADEGGRASVRFELPRFQGALRLMAVSYAGRRFGAESASARVRDPLVVLPTFPRFLSFEETAEIPVTVRNDTGRDGSFEVSLATSGAVRIDGEAKQPVQIEEGAEQTVHFRVASAPRTGTVTMEATASGNGETTRSEKVELAVRPDLPATTREAVGSLTEVSSELALDAETDFRPGTVERHLRLGPLPLVQLSAQLRHAVGYPYGCLEQVTSGAFPLIYLGDLARELEPELFEEAEPAAMVQAGIQQIANLQLSTGGFSLWPGGDAVAPWPSIYAAHFLVEARRGGFLVPGFLYDHAIAFLDAEARAREGYAGDELERVVYALYVLARADEPDLGTMDFVRQRHAEGLKALPRALLAGAYAAIGRGDAVEEMLAGLEDVERIRRQTGGNFSSTTRNRAMVLLALLDADPEHPAVPRLAQRLGRDARTSPWWNTQESSFALLALGQLFRRQAERPPYSGRVLVDGKEIGRFGADTTVFELPATGAVRVEMDPGYEAGSAFYSLRVRGVPTDAAFAPVTAGLELHTSLKDRNGRPLDLASVAQGDLVVLKSRIRSASGRLENVALQLLLPAGFEVENPRLATSETLPWITDANLDPAFFDFRDDQALVFLDLPDAKWRTAYVLLRAMTPGTFRLPPAHAEAMYEPEIQATGERGTLEVALRR